VVNRASDFFGVAAETVGAIIEKVFKDNGKPTGYIAGEEGSAAFVVGNVVAGLFLSLTSAAAIPFELAALGLISIGAALHASPLRGLAHAPAPPEAGPASTRGLGLLIVVAAAYALIQASHSLVNTFASLHWAREGHSSAFVGVAWAIGVVCETWLFALAGRWFSGPDRALTLLAIGGATATARWLVMASDPGAALLLVSQASHGLTFASTHLGSMLFIFARAPAHMRARAQGWLVAAVAGLSALLIALSGPLYAHFGEVAYLAMAALAASGLALTIAVGARKDSA